MNVFDAVHDNDFDTVIKVVLLKAVANSALFRAVGAIRQSIRQRKATQRQDAIDAQMSDADQRNQHDDDERARGEVERLMGFEVAESPELLASRLLAVRDNAIRDLATVGASRFDQAMSLKDCLSYLLKDHSNMPEATVKALAEAIGVDPKVIRTLADVVAHEDYNRLVEDQPEIIQFVSSHDGNGWDEAIDGLDPVTQHQVHVKAFQNLEKEQDKVLKRVIRSGSIRDIGSLHLLKEAQPVFRKFVEDFETKHMDALSAAMEAGRNIPSCDDPVR